MLSLLLACGPESGIETAAKAAAEDCYIDQIGRNPDQFERPDDAPVALITSDLQIDASLHDLDDIDVYTIDLFDDAATDLLLDVKLLPDTVEQLVHDDLDPDGEVSFKTVPVHYELQIARPMDGGYEVLDAAMPDDNGDEVMYRYDVSWAEGVFDIGDDSGTYEIRVAAPWNNGTGPVGCEHAYSLHIEVESAEDPNPPNYGNDGSGSTGATKDDGGDGA